MKNILLLAHDDDGQDARLQAALAIVRALGGHLTCLDVAVVPERMTDFVAQGAGTLLFASEQRGEARNAVQLQERLRHEHVRFDLIETTGFLPQILREHAALADLIVVSTALESGYPNMERVIAELLGPSRRPVFAVPEKAQPLSLEAAHALIAWDGSLDAEATLRAAVPLLRLADKVTIVQVDDGSLALPVDDAARYLSRHRIDPAVHEIGQSDERTCFVVEEVIERMSPTYLVLGGFGRSRFSETVFGGVSHRMVTRSRIPLFMAHRRA